MTSPTSAARLIRVESGRTSEVADLLAVEAPLEIRIGESSVSITMRTPGDDRDLAAGFLFAEGIISARDHIESIDLAPDTVSVRLTPGAPPRAAASDRGFVMTSACGVCGKESLEALAANRCPVLPEDNFCFDAALLHAFPETLRQRQAVFESTGGLHAAALFNSTGELSVLREDVGRHNAVDKLIGQALLSGEVPLSNSILLVSGRASFELVQKALVAGIPVLAAVGAPSSLAVSTARDAGMTLIGFLREGRFNIYSRPERILTRQTP